MFGISGSCSSMPGVLLSDFGALGFTRTTPLSKMNFDHAPLFNVVYNHRNLESQLAMSATNSTLIRLLLYNSVNLLDDIWLSATY